MRTGQIISYNKIAGTGVIKDTNDQQIRFIMTDIDFSPARGMLVVFEIAFRDHGLAAIDVDIFENGNLSQFLSNW